MARGPLIEVTQVDPWDDVAYDEWFRAYSLTDAERWPEKPGWQRAELVAFARNTDGPEYHRCLRAHRGGETVGVAHFHTFRRENPHLARIDVRVLPPHRRQGVGRSLVAVAQAILRSEGKTELAGMDESPVRPGYVDAAGPFARALGFAPAQEMMRRGIRLPFSPDDSARLQSDPRARPEGYSLLVFHDPWPDDYIEDRCELGRRMSTDVPHEGQQIDEEVWDVDRVRGIEGLLAAQNRARLTTAARDDATGRLVGFTEIAVPLDAPSGSWQHDTLVMREHRGKGLGFAMKVANLLALQDAHPDVRTVSTWNARENAHMIAVNEQIGFEVEATSVYWLQQL
jgi:GNAT superfamily N-acetyltransferase